MRVRENFRDDPKLDGGFRFPFAADNGVAGTAWVVFLSRGVLEMALFGLLVKASVKLFADDD